MQIHDEEKKDRGCGMDSGIFLNQKDGQINVKILGSGCAKCHTLGKTVSDSMKELGCGFAVQYVTDFIEIAKYGVMQTPALVVGNTVISSGRVLSKAEVITLLKKEMKKGVDIN